MKKIVSFLLIAAVAALVVVSCNKPAATPNKNNDQNKENTNDGGDEPEEDAKLAIDGKFGEWTSIDPVEGGDGLLLMKAQMTEDVMYFYIEADAAALYVDDCSFANYLTLYLDCGNGAEALTYWGGEEGCTYEIAFQIWLMQKAKASMANWDAGFKGRAKIADGVYKGEFCLSRNTEALKSKVIYFGAALTDQYVEYPEDGASEGEWMAGEVIGLCPEQDEDMAKLK